jgi:RNA polymerase sigma-70 factor, ECF subfamily
MTRDATPTDSDSPTSIHVRRAVAGDLESLGWVVERFSPVLLAQARFRLGPALRRFCDPEDLVSDAWAVALRRLGDLEMAADSSTGTLVRYLGTVVLRRVRDLARLAAVRRSAIDDPQASKTTSPSQVDAMTTSIVTRAIRGERSALILKAIEALEPLDRQVVVLRGIEGAAVAEVAAIMNTTAGAVATRYHRALRRLREQLPDTVVAELTED